MGLDTLAATTGEDAGTIEAVYEPYLMQLGFLMRTTRGRVCTVSAYKHMNRTAPAQIAEPTVQQVNMFEGQENAEDK